MKEALAAEDERPGGRRGAELERLDLVAHALDGLTPVYGIPSPPGNTRGVVDRAEIGLAMSVWRSRFWKVIRCRRCR